VLRVSFCLNIPITSCLGSTDCLGGLLWCVNNGVFLTGVTCLRYDDDGKRFLEDEEKVYMSFPKDDSTGSQLSLYGDNSE
jgi:hypothetical protein